MQKTTVGWLTWELTHSTLWVGTIALCDFIAALVITPLAGALTDRSNPFKLLMLTQAMLIGLSLVLWLLIASESLSIWLLFIWAIIEAMVSGLNQPVRMVSIAYLASPGQMSQAIASNSLAGNLARIIGPALAGILMFNDQTAQVLLLNALSYVAMIIAVLLVRQQLNRCGSATRQHSIFSQMQQGVSYIKNTPGITNLLLLLLGFALLARPFTELMPALAGAVFEGGADTLAMLMSAQGIGALIGAAFLLRKRRPEHLPFLIIVASLGISLALTTLALTSSLSWALLVIAIAGLFHVTCNICMQTATQLICDPAMKGRVMSVYGLLFKAMPAIGAFSIALASTWLPLPWLLAGAAAIFGFLVLLYLTPLKDLRAILQSTDMTKP